MYRNNWDEYKAISTLYGDKTTKRSGIKLMNHIDEGLYILEKIGASENAKRAYCMHPIAQDDNALLGFYFWRKMNPDYASRHEVTINVMEYRSVANEYLSTRNIRSIDEIRLSPLKDVNDMLIADKIQNRKDFELYHLGKHERSSELDSYFKNWLERLDITEEFYQETKKELI
jgi:hypothetical protein